MKIMRPALDLPIAQLRALGLGVRGVRDDQQWRVEQRFDFFHRHAVLLALSQVARVPVETCQGSLMPPCYTIVYTNTSPPPVWS